MTVLFSSHAARLAVISGLLMLIGFAHPVWAEEGASDKARVRSIAHRVFGELRDYIPQMAGDDSPLPPGAEYVDVLFPKADSEGMGDTVHILIDFPDEFVSSKEFNEYTMTRIGMPFVYGLGEEGISSYFLFARDPKTNEYVDIQKLLPVEPVPEWDPEPDHASMEMSAKQGKPAVRELTAADKATMPVINPGQPQGALSGITVYINQSHGWFDDVDFGRWRVQRGLCYGINEDLASAEFMSLYVMPMLRNAGAKVQTVRESDPQTRMVIVDNADGSSNPSNGVYRETGSWSTSSINGFVQKTTASWNGVTVNPFNQGAGQNRLSGSVTTGAPTATAEWVANIPASGYYNVYASWAAFSARAQDAQYFVHHSGGVSEVRVDQTIDGYTWFLLGNWYFEAGAPEDERKVVLTNHSSDATATNVSADAVRWGGGMGDVARQTHGISGRPRWEEEAINYLQFTGFGYSGTLYGGVDDEAGGWSDRPQYARWEHSQKDASVEDAIYFAWHTNALSGCASGSSAARGLSTFRHSTATAASLSLQTIMHNTMYSHIEGMFFPGWTVRSKYETNFGENNQSSLGTGLPGFLIEGLFHDNETDTTAYGEPEFRTAYARAIVQGVINYFESRDGVTLANPPETPTNFRVEWLGNGQARLSWNPPPNNSNNQYFGSAATGYRVYTSHNGLGFDDGISVTGTSTVVSGLMPGEPVFYRVAATNAGGQSFPTETLAACEGSRNVLIVNGFDRNQRSLIPTATISNLGSSVLRIVPSTFQAFNYIREHALALAPHGARISSASNEAVAAGQVALGDYAAVFWILGEEATLDDAFSTTEQGLVSAYLSAGGNLFTSGAEIGWDLDAQGSTDDQQFFNNVLGADYVGDDSNTYNVAAGTGIFAGLPAFNFNPASGARYDAEYPDRLNPASGAQIALSYSGGTGDGAGIVYSGAYKTVVLGFPFETITSAQTRTDMMGKVLTFFNVPDEASHPSAWILYGD